MLPYIGEFLGTLLLLLLGTSSVANASLKKSGAKDVGNLQIMLAWAFAVMIPAFIFGNASGAHFNPALTIAWAIDGTIEWSIVPGYILCQFAGAFCGACIMFVMFKDHFDATDDKAVKKDIFCTAPSIRNISRNIFCEAVATFVLIFAIKGIGQIESAGGSDEFLIFAVIASIGMSFGGLTGYALNPARDIGGRLAHFLLPIQNKGDSDWAYTIVPICGPIIGAILGVLVYGAIPWA